MTAAYAQLAYYRYPALWAKAESELEVINQCLVEMAKRYPSAVGAQRVIRAVFRAVQKQERHEGPLQLLFEKDQRKYFDHLGPELCGKWDFVYGSPPHDTNESTQGSVRPDSTGTSVDRPSNSVTLVGSNQPLTSTTMAPPMTTEYREPVPEFDPMLPVDATLDAFSGSHDYPFATVGNWMLGDWMADLGWTTSENPLPT